MKTTRPVVGVFHNRNGKLRTEHTYRDFICGNIIIGKTYCDFLLIINITCIVMLIHNNMLSNSKKSPHLRHQIKIIIEKKHNHSHRDRVGVGTSKGSYKFPAPYLWFDDTL